MSPGDISSVSPVSARSEDGAPQKLPSTRGKKKNRTSATGAAFRSMAPVVRNGRGARPSVPRRETRSSAAASSQTVDSTQAAVAMSCAYRKAARHRNQPMKMRTVWSRAVRVSSSFSADMSASRAVPPSRPVIVE